ncbi:DNA-directed RNA polymerase [Candidatus Woesearchaeota archaeon]|nr:DNA-directed RNA polymerase [Candidatus Woesearchaeota archaeon]
MFYRAEIKDHIRVSPNLFNEKIEDAVTQCIRNKYEGFISQELGFVIDVSKVNDIQEGVVIAGDGAAYYETSFELLAYKPELQEIVLGKIKDVADFGAFISLGPIEGMIHVSQTMDDFVSFSKEKVLVGKDSKRNLKVNDECKARVIAVSFKDLTNPKIGLTMRQTCLGKIDWIAEDLSKDKKK